MTIPVIVVDTGVLVALADADHTMCTGWLANCRTKLVIPAAIIGEICYILGTRCGGEVEAAFLESLAANDPFVVDAPLPDDHFRAAALVRKYADFPLGGSDASVIAWAERFGSSDVATLDHRHFRAVRPKHTQAFNLVP